MLSGCGTDERLFSDHLLDRRSSCCACAFRLFGSAWSPSGGSGRLLRVSLSSAGRGRRNLLLPGSSPARPLGLVNSNDSDSTTNLNECLHPTPQIFDCRCDCLCHMCGPGISGGTSARRSNAPWHATAPVWPPRPSHPNPSRRVGPTSPSSLPKCMAGQLHPSNVRIARRCGHASAVRKVWWRCARGQESASRISTRIEKGCHFCT